MSRRTTINDVAKLASVGKVTVSYVLNGRDKEAGISPETSERVRAAAKTLNYRPNGVARMLARNRADSIAVVFQYAHFFSATSTFLNEALRGVCNECVNLDIDVMLHTKQNEDPLAEADALSDGRVDGVLMLRDAGDPTLATLIERRFPVVLFFSRAESPDVSFVDCDNFTGGKIAANHLLSLGHKRLAMVVGSANSVDSSDRFQGYRSSIEAAGLRIEPDQVVRLEAPDSDPSELITLLRSPQRPTALFVWSDDVAFECLRVARDLGINVPTELSIIGFDSTAACNRVDPPLTSIRQPILEMARTATGILHAIVQDGGGAVQQIVFPPHLDIRGSTGPLNPQFESEQS
ncbi:MAG TPA: LacI family DNA-binding transcriptional regulator [Fimbriimonadaceae bacterium]|nr:LacI family DNA-binding transcriptional regulator [Fimbriimonadaceae bacterium]